MDDAVWDHSSFTTNRDRLIGHDAVRALYGRIVMQAEQAGLLSDEHFSVDGTLIRAWASHKSLVPRDGPPPPTGGAKSNPEVNFKGQQRKNDSHVSKTDPDALLARKSKNEGAYPSYTGHILMENRNGLAVDVPLTQATGRAEREAALDMLKDQTAARTVGADKHYDTTVSWRPAANKASPRMWRGTRRGPVAERSTVVLPGMRRKGGCRDVYLQ
jgi:hypothetical protein